MTLISKSIEDFLAFLRETRTLNRIARADEEETNDQTQDILHNSKTHVLVIDKPYSLDKVAEARAVNWALLSGACDKCEHLLKCSNDRNFKFPASAACMKKKAELLEVGE